MTALVRRFAPLLICLIVGCVTSTSGQRMDTAQVNAIRKGVTTRAEVERQFGPPIATAMMLDGRRVLSFGFSETKMKGESFIPFHGGGADLRRQSLQVIVGPDGVVQDYEFNDTTGESRFGPLGAGGTHTEHATDPGTSR